jgi:hypothetical protein
VELAGRSVDMEGEDDESRELWGRMQEAAWRRNEVPPVVNREWWALASAGRRLKAALSAFLKYAEQAEQGGQEPSDQAVMEDLGWIREESAELIRLMEAELERRGQ